MKCWAILDFSFKTGIFDISSHIVLCFRCTCGIILSFLVLIWNSIKKITGFFLSLMFWIHREKLVQNQQNNLIIPFQSDIALHMDIPIFRHSLFFVLFKTKITNSLQNRYNMFVISQYRYLPVLVGTSQNSRKR